MKRMKSFFAYLWRYKIRTAILLVTALVTLFFVWPKNGVEIETATVQKGAITQSITATGSVASEQTVTLSLLSAGKIVYVGAVEGDEVSAGQTLVSLDQRTIRKNLEQTLIDYSKQRNSFEEVRDDNEERTPQTALDDTMKRLLEDNQNDLDKAIGSVELQNLALDQSYITTPITGIVISSDMQTAGINASAQNKIIVADPEKLVFQIDVDESDIGKISLDKVVRVILDAYPETPLTLSVSHIDFASHTTETGGNVYTVEAQLPLNTDFRYRIGMNGDAEIIVAEKYNVTTIPIASLIDDNHVYVKKDKTFEKRRITTGMQSDITVEVINGLQVGEEIALQPQEVEEKMK